MDDAVRRLGSLQVHIPSQHLLVKTDDRHEKIDGGVLLHPLLNAIKFGACLLLNKAYVIAVEQEHRTTLLAFKAFRLPNFSS
jgi:hypothetical protein